MMMSTPSMCARARAVRLPVGQKTTVGTMCRDCHARVPRSTAAAAASVGACVVSEFTGELGQGEGALAD